jgi:hypothetical protein
MVGQSTGDFVGHQFANPFEVSAESQPILLNGYIAEFGNVLIGQGWLPGKHKHGQRVSLAVN